MHFECGGRCRIIPARPVLFPYAVISLVSNEDIPARISLRTTTIYPIAFQTQLG